MCFGCQLRMSLMMLYDDLFWIWNSRYRNTVQKYFGKCLGPKFSVITLNSGNSSVNKQKTESEKEKNGHTLGLTSTNSKVQITLNNITDSTPERVLQKKGELYSSPFPFKCLPRWLALCKPADLTNDPLSPKTETKKMTIQGGEMKNGISFKE